MDLVNGLLFTTNTIFIKSVCAMRIGFVTIETSNCISNCQSFFAGLQKSHKGFKVANFYSIMPPK